ncbi:Uma2 family endonuclease [Streptomyces xanthophaeus]
MTTLLPPFEALLRTVEEMSLPAGFKAEITRGRTVVSPPHELRCLRPLRALRRQLEAGAPAGHVAETFPALFAFPSARSAYGPDLFVADESALDADCRHADGGALSLVAEFTSASTQGAGHWNEKLEVYGLLVPVCLLVDVPGSEITCFADPSPHGYRFRTTVSFGEGLPVPEPFGSVFVTAGF